LCDTANRDFGNDKAQGALIRDSVKHTVICTYT
jgi:hypothetical protein